MIGDTVGSTTAAEDISRKSLDIGTSNHAKPLSVFTRGFDVGQGFELEIWEASV